MDAFCQEDQHQYVRITVRLHAADNAGKRLAIRLFIDLCKQPKRYSQ
jgi:hypothetical protein